MGSWISSLFGSSNNGTAETATTQEETTPVSDSQPNKPEAQSNEPEAQPNESTDVIEKHTLVIKDDRFKEGTTEITYEGPLTKEQLQIYALQPGQLFLVFFPSQSNQIAFLDTVNKTLSFRQESSQQDLSILMILKTVSSTAQRNPQYTWRTVVLPEEYFSVTGATVIGGSRKVTFTVYPSTRNIPTWVVDSRNEDRFVLSFQQTDDTQVWSLNPIIIGANDKEVVGASDEVYTARVYHVTSNDAKNLPIDYVVPPTIEGTDP